MPAKNYPEPSARRFHAYNIGTAKSGTHSIAGIFQTGYRAAHEPAHWELIQWLLQHKSRHKTSIDIGSHKKDYIYFAERDRRLNLELEASGPLSFVVNFLVTQFPQAKFIFTVRDCYSWLDSYINHQLNAHKRAEKYNYWWEYRDLCLCPDLFKHDKRAAMLADYELYPLDSYLRHWHQFNTAILKAVPEERLLIVRTADISRSIERIADFLSVDATTLDSSATHLFKAKQKFHLLEKIDPDFLAQKTTYYCQPLMTEFFPEIRQWDDI